MKRLVLRTLLAAVLALGAAAGVSAADTDSTTVEFEVTNPGVVWGTSFVAPDDPVFDGDFLINAIDGDIQNTYVWDASITVASTTTYSITVEVQVDNTPAGYWETNGVSMNTDHSLIDGAAAFEKGFDVALTDQDDNWAAWSVTSNTVSGQENTINGGDNLRTHLVEVALVLFDEDGVGTGRGQTSGNGQTVPRFKEFPAGDRYAVTVVVTVAENL